MRGIRSHACAGGNSSGTSRSGVPDREHHELRWSRVLELECRRNVSLRQLSEQFLECDWCFEPFGAVVNASMETTLSARVAGEVNGREYPEEEDDFGEIVGPLSLFGPLSISSGTAPMPPVRGLEFAQAVVRVPFRLTVSLARRTAGTQVGVEPLGNQRALPLPSGPRVPHALAHDKSSRHVRFGQ